MKANWIKQAFLVLVLGLMLASCGPAYVRYGRPYGYYDRPYGYYRRPGPTVIVTPPPRVYYRNQYRYRNIPPAYGRRYNKPGYGNRGNRRW